MNILNKFFITGLALSSLLVVSCSDDSEDLTPSEAEKNVFMVDPSRTDDEAMIRKAFYETTGIHLIFTDSLIHSDGSLEMLDFNWGFNTESSDVYRFTYMTDKEDMEQAAELLSRYFVPYISGGKLRPFSMLPFKKIEFGKWSNKKQDYNWSSIDFISNWRCFAVNTEDWAELEPDEYKEAGRELLMNFIDANLNYKSRNSPTFLSSARNITGRTLMRTGSKKRTCRKSMLSDSSPMTTIGKVILARRMISMISRISC